MAFELAFSGTSSAAAFAALLSLLWLSTRSLKRNPLGPRSKFLVGNLKDLLSKGYEWVKYAAMTREYGAPSVFIIFADLLSRLLAVSDVLYFAVLGTPLLVINSFEAALELLDKKREPHPSHPCLVMIKEL